MSETISDVSTKRQGLVGDRSIAGYLRAHLSRLQPGDYFAMLAYLAMIDRYEVALQGMRLAVRDRTCAATGAPGASRRQRGRRVGHPSSGAGERAQAGS